MITQKKELKIIKLEIIIIIKFYRVKRAIFQKKYYIKIILKQIKNLNQKNMTIWRNFLHKL